MKYYIVTLFILVALMVGCAGPNPNVGERTSDMAWLNERYAEAVDIVKPRAERGEPWAQLRLAMFYEGGMGMGRNMELAIQWYEKVAVQKAEGDWAEGLMVGATGRNGYFNQNSDARIAQYNLAVIFLKGKHGVKKDLIKSYVNIRTVVEETNGRDIFFCCEFAGGRIFPAKDIARTYQEVLQEMTPEQKAEAEKKFLEVKLIKIK